MQELKLRILVEDTVVIELKCSNRLGGEDACQVSELHARLGQDPLYFGQERCKIGEFR